MSATPMQAWYEAQVPTSVPPLFVQQAASVWSASTVSPITLGHNTTQNNLLFGVLSIYSGSGGLGQVGTVTDSQSNTWAVDVENLSATTSIAIVRAKLTTALTTSDTITVPVTGGGSPSIFAAQFLEFTGSYFSASPFDKSSSGSATGTSVATGSTGTLSQASELAITGCTHDASNTSSWTPPATWTEVATGLGNNVQDAAYLKVNATTALNPTWANSPSHQMGAAIATYKLA